jgi:excisionase family DNA binding protein
VHYWKKEIQDTHIGGSKQDRRGQWEMEKEVFTLKQAAEFLQLSRRSLYKLVKEGEIPGKKILSRWRFEKGALMRWLNDGDGGRHTAQ